METMFKVTATQPGFMDDPPEASVAYFSDHNEAQEYLAREVDKTHKATGTLPRRHGDSEVQVGHWWLTLSMVEVEINDVCIIG